MSDGWNTNPWPNAAIAFQQQTAWPQPAATLSEPIPEAMQQRLRDERFPVTPDGVLMLWEKRKKDLAALKDDEMEIRKLAVKVFVAKPTEGMNSVALGEGYTLKADIKFNYVLDGDNKKVEAALDQIAALSNEGPFIAERLINWQPIFLLTEYRKLQDDATGPEGFAKQFAIKALAILTTILTITDAAPTLEIREPKKKK